MNEYLKEIVKTIFASFFKASEFKTSRLNLSGRTNDAVKLANFQVRQTRSDFYINIDLSFDGIRAYRKEKIEFTPSYRECFCVFRLEALISAPEKRQIIQSLEKKRTDKMCC